MPSLHILLAQECSRGTAMSFELALYNNAVFQVASTINVRRHGEHHAFKSRLGG